MNTTYEEAKKCPRCSVPGHEASRTPVATGANSDIKPGTVAAVVECRNNSCRWFNTTWIVQINKDGTVPIIDPEVRRRMKQFPVQNVPEIVQRSVDALERQAALELQKGTELGGR